MSLYTDKLGQFREQESRFVNELIAQAVERATGDFPVLNLYDYVNRMSKQQDPTGETLYLDGVPILWVGRPKVSEVRDWLPEIKIETPYRFLIADNKKPAEAGLL